MKRTMTRRRPSNVCLRALVAGLVASLLVSCHGAHGYVTGALPFGKQVVYLETLTNELLDSVGPLTNTQLDNSHTLIDAWSKTNVQQSAQRVETLLKRLLNERESGNSHAGLDVHDYNCLLISGKKDAYRVEDVLRHMQQHKVPMPNLDSFKAGLMAWWHLREDSPVSEAPVRAQQLLEWMVELYATEQNMQAKPDADCFDIVLQLWSRSTLPQAPRQAEQLVYAMERLQLSPRATSFNAILAAWKRSSNNQQQVARRATDIIEFMLQEGITPDPTTYQLLFQIYAQSPPTSAVLQLAETTLRKRIPPADSTTVMYNTVIGLYSKCKILPDKHRHARSLLDRQLSLSQTYPHLRPDVVGLTAALQSCVNGAEHPQVKATAKFIDKLFVKLQIQPNHVTYATLLQVFPDKSATIFERAIQAGCVSDLVLHRLRQAQETSSSSKSRRRLFGPLPESWTRRVVHQQRSRKRAEV